MTPWSRRALLATLATAAVAGCVSEDDDASENGNRSNDTDDTTDMDPDNATDDDDGANDTLTDREAELERLPDRSPLSTALQDFFAAEDRESYAAGNSQMDYRDGTIRVEITLEPDGDRPEAYLPDETSGYGDTIVAFVDVDDLVDLALDENVRLVSLPPQPQTHD